MSCRVLLSASRGEGVLLSRTDPAAGPGSDGSHPVQRGAGERRRTLRPSHRLEFRRQQREVEELKQEQSSLDLWLREHLPAASRHVHGSCRRPLPRSRRAHGPEGGEDGGRPVRVQPQHPEAGLGQLLAGRRCDAVQLQRLGLAQPGPAAEERRAGRPRLDCRETRRLARSSLVFQRHAPLLQPVDAVASPPFLKETLCREWNLFLIEPRLNGKLQAFKGVQFFYVCIAILYMEFILLGFTAHVDKTLIFRLVKFVAKYIDI